MPKQFDALVAILLLAVAVSGLLPWTSRQQPSELAKPSIGTFYEKRSTQSHQDSSTCLFQQATEQATTNQVVLGTVVRTALREYDKTHSKPSGANYTTRKDAQSEGIQITKTGIQGDYNHYRTTALKSTPDRAVLIQTSDILPLLHSEQFPVEIGDFGENLSLEGAKFDDFQVGRHYQFRDAEEGEGSVIVEITERAEPCGNLCKLPYINDESLEPKERIQKCKDLLELLNRADGLRGWYAKVIQEGFVRPGDRIVAMQEEDEEE